MAGFIAPLVGLATDYLGYRKQSSANARAGTALADSASEGIKRTEDAVFRELERLGITSGNATNRIQTESDWAQKLITDAKTRAAADRDVTTGASNNYLATLLGDTQANISGMRSDTNAYTDARLGDTQANTRRLLAQTQAGYQPYMTAGQTALDRLNELQGTPTSANRLAALLDNPANLENTPGYQWQLAQGLKGVNQQASSRGLVSSGGTAKALMQYGQGLAGTSYQNAIANALSSDRLELDKQQQNRNLNLALSGQGLEAAGGYGSSNEAFGRDYMGANQFASTSRQGANQFAAQMFGQTNEAFGKPIAQNILDAGIYRGNLDFQGAQQEATINERKGITVSELEADAAAKAAGFDLQGQSFINQLLANRGAATASSILGNAGAFQSLLGSTVSNGLDIFGELMKKKPSTYIYGPDTEG